MSEITPENIAAIAFAELPHVQSVWVDANGDYYLHPKQGATKVERNAAPKEESGEEGKPVVKKNKK